MKLTERNVWRIVRDLRNAGMVRKRRVRGRYHYYVNLGAQFLHPTLSGFTLETVLGRIARGRSGSRKGFPAGSAA